MTANLETTRRNLLFLLSAALGLPRGASGAEGKYPRNLTQADIDRWMKELSNWGRWGKEDQAGAVNLITPAKRRKAAALVREGWSVSMALNADLPKEGPTSGPAAAGPPGGASPGAGGPSARGGQQGASAAPAARGGLGGGVPRATWTLTSRPPTGAPRPLAAYVVDSFSVSYHGNYTSHLDSMAHLHFNGQIYNGFPTSAYTDRGAGKNDVLPFKDGIFTRGLLFDIPRLKGVKYLGDDEPIYPEDLEAWEKKAGFKAEAGDVVLVRTGRWVRVAEKGDLNLNQFTPGLYASCAKWLHERDVAVLGSDVVQDVRPSRVENVNQPLHQLMLWAVGVPLLDNLQLDALSEAAAQRRRWTFLVTINPLRIPGATGGPVNPIATF